MYYFFPSPTKHAPVCNTERIGQVRRLHCRLYDRCLNTAVKNGWEGFSCLDCAVRDDKSTEELREEANFIRASFIKARQ